MCSHDPFFGTSKNRILKNGSCGLAFTCILPFQSEAVLVYCAFTLKSTFHLTISMRAQHATGKIQRNNYHHGNCGPSLTGKTMSVFLIFMQGTHRNVKNR